jgi:hypothetical protein
MAPSVLTITALISERWRNAADADNVSPQNQRAGSVQPQRSQVVTNNVIFWLSLHDLARPPLLETRQQLAYFGKAGGGALGPLGVFRLPLGGEGSRALSAD